MSTFNLRVHTRWPIDDRRQFDDPEPIERGYLQGTAEIPLHAVSWIEHARPPELPKRRQTMVDRILSALDGMGGSAKSKNALYKAVGGSRPDFLKALNTAESRGMVRVEGTRVIVEDS